MIYRPQPKSPYFYEARPGETFFFEEFITPTAFAIQQIVKGISGDNFEEIGPKAYAHVGSIKYIIDQDLYKVTEYFAFPFETLAKKAGDCEDTANLFTSILEACGLMQAATVYGTVSVDEAPYRHSWTEVDNVMVETTLDEYMPIPRPDFYHPEVRVTSVIAYMVAPPVGWKVQAETPIVGPFGAQVPLKKLSEEELKKLHEKLKKLKELKE